ncbi:MAG TPA: S8 family serine peptidase [Actinomycetota bacterium]|nr:S8 family serine peptidase [Actinomycetota bacterium]
MQRGGHPTVPRALRGVVACLSAIVVAVPLAVGGAAGATSAEHPDRPTLPAIARSDVEQLYFVVMRAPSLVQRMTRERVAPQPSVERTVALGQEAALQRVRSLGGRVGFRYTRLVNAFSATLTPSDAAALQEHPDVARLEPVGIARRANATSVPYIGARKVWKRDGARGEGMRVAVIDTGIDYTHAAFGGPGTVRAYDGNKPTVREKGTFPTKKVVGGWDFVGENYNVLDGSTANDTPDPDPDPLDGNGHGTHAAGTCCGKRVKGHVGRGVAPKAKIFAYKVWDEGNSTADVLVAAYERAIDPNRDGNLDDRVDVVSFSGGVNHGSATSLESLAAQRVVDAGTVFVAAAGNAGNQITGDDPYVLGAPATAPGVIAVAASADPSESSGLKDPIAGFSSEGPARVTNELKPDIAAPGVGIDSASAGGGKASRVMSGTSMATPHVAGAAILLRQLHPGWSPQRIKAVLMNNAKPKMQSIEGRSPVPATVQGAGLIRLARAASARTIVTPGSLSYGLQHLTERSEIGTQTLLVRNTSGRARDYEIEGTVRYSDLGPEVADVEVSVDGGPFEQTTALTVAAGDSAEIGVRLSLDPYTIDARERVFGWYSVHPNVDGAVIVREERGRSLRVPWHAAPLAASAMSVQQTSIDLPGDGNAHVAFDIPPAPGINQADMYLLGAEDPLSSGGEEDITHIGARTFTGDGLRDGPEGVPEGRDAFAQSTWIDTLAERDGIREPIEFVVRTAGIHNTSATIEVDVAIDVGNDGVFASPRYKADFIAVKTQQGYTCLFDLSLPQPFKSCVARHAPDYPAFNTGLTGVAVDARSLGLTQGTEIGYEITVCTGVFSGDDPRYVCDTAGAFDESQDRYEASIVATDPALRFDPLTCGGPWEGPFCSEGIDVARGSGEGSEVLVVFPNNAPTDDVAVVEVN